MKLNLLQKARRWIDIIDFLMIFLLSCRYKQVKKVIEHKRKKNLQVVDKERESQQTLRVQKIAKKFGLPEKIAVGHLRSVIALFTEAEMSAIGNPSIGKLVTGRCPKCGWATTGAIAQDGMARCVCKTPLELDTP